MTPTGAIRLFLPCAVAVFLPTGTATAELLPEALGPFERTSLEPFQPPQADLFAELGLEEAEQGRYLTAQGEALELTAYRFQDSTGAFASYQWLRPDGGELVPYGEQALRQGNATTIRFGSYVVQMEGPEADDEHVEAMLAFLPRVTLSARPPVLKYVPTNQLIPYSGRYILGPVSLEEVAPEVPPSVAAFHFGTEGQYVLYDTPSGQLRMILFSYPSPQIAQGQIGPFNELAQITAKRAGPLIATVISSPSADETQRLLSRVRYAAEVTETHRTSHRYDDLSVLLLDIIFFCIFLAVLMIVGGGIVAGSRFVARRYAPNSILGASDEASLLRLDIDQRGPG